MNLLLVPGEAVQIPIDDLNAELKFSEGPNNTVHYKVLNQDGTAHKGYAQGAAGQMRVVNTPEGQSMYVYAPTPTEVDPNYKSVAPIQSTGAQAPTQQTLKPGVVYSVPPESQAGAPLVPVADSKNGGAAKNGKEGSEKSDKKSDKKDSKSKDSKGGSTGSSNGKNNGKDKKNGASLYIIVTTALISSFLMVSM